jgi:4,5-DOPA dioxygenase extradiol
MSTLTPALFVGHGNPIYALRRNRYTAAWAKLGTEIPLPKAILCISAHWYISSAALTVNSAPPTIHDFGGFPPELYQVQYPAPGDPGLARRVKELLAPLPVALEEGWGLDHGAWSVLRHMYPNADVPVVQLSIDRGRHGEFHYEIGMRLACLRAEGVLVLGSGNVVHNLSAMVWGEGSQSYEWARRFEALSKELLLAENDQSLIQYEKLGRDAQLSIPTPDHYLPLLYSLGTRQPGDAVTFPIEGIDGGSISMLAVRFG